MSKRFTVSMLLVSVLVIGLLSACNPTAAPTATPQLEPIVLQLSWTYQTSYAPYFAAVHEGYYAEEGIDLSFIEGGFNDAGYINPITALTENRAQFSLHSANALIQARANGTPVVVINTNFQTSPRAFISLADKNIRTPQDFVGRRVVLRDGGDVSISYQELMSSLNIDRSGVTEIFNPDLDNIDALIADEVDVIAVFAPEEVVELQQMGYEVNVIMIQDYGVAVDQGNIFVLEDTITNNPDLVERFLRATTRGFDYVIRNPVASAEIISQYTGQTAESILPHLQRTVPLFQPVGTYPGQVNEANWALVQEMMISQGILTETFNVSTMINASFGQKIFTEIYGS